MSRFEIRPYVTADEGKDAWRIWDHEEHRYLMGYYHTVDDARYSVKYAFTDDIANARRDIIRAATDLVALWDARRIAGASRAERNSAIDDVRKELTRAVHALAEANAFEPKVASHG